MPIHHTGLRIGFATAALLLLGSAAPAQSARQECGFKYHAAKSEGTLGGLTWPQFFSRCMMEARNKPSEPQAAPSQAPKAEEATEETTPKPEEAPAAPSTEADSAETPATEPSAAETEQAPAAEAEAEPKPADAAPASDDAAATETPPPAAEPDGEETATEPKPLEAPAEIPATEAPQPEPKPALPEAAAEPPAGPVFPTAVSPTYAKDGPEIARKKTCLDQFKANKATDANAGLRWIQKGGGYFSLCDQHLKSKK